MFNKIFSEKSDNNKIPLYTIHNELNINNCTVVRSNQEDHMIINQKYQIHIFDTNRIYHQNNEYFSFFSDFNSDKHTLEINSFLVPDEDKKEEKLNFIQISKIEQNHIGFIYEKKQIFDIKKEDKISLFTNVKYDLDEDKDSIYLTEVKKMHSKKRINKGSNSDNIRKILKTEILNDAITNTLNKELKKEGYIFEFCKFPFGLCRDITKKNNKEILKMTLSKIYETKELYKDNELHIYYHNLELLNELRKEKNFEFERIMNVKFGQICRNYLISNEFKAKINSKKHK